MIGPTEDQKKLFLWLGGILLTLILLTIIAFFSFSSDYNAISNSESSFSRPNP